MFNQTKQIYPMINNDLEILKFNADYLQPH